MPRRRPSQPLSRQRILETALALADRDGLDALSMRRLGAELGVDPMSLYNHVDGKAGVLDGIVELLIADADLPVDAGSWQEWVRRFAAAFDALAERHPRAFAVFSVRPVGAPSVMAPFETVIDALRREGFSPSDAWRILNTVAGVVAGLSLLRAGPALIPSAAAYPQADEFDLDPETFPRLTEMLAQEQPSFDETIAFAVELVIEGVDRRRPRPRRRGTRRS